MRERQDEAVSPYDEVQATEGERGMPGRQEPKKDVVHCEKRRGAVCRQRTGGVRMRKPGELKHLSTRRKRDDSASSGERKPSSPNRRLRPPGLQALATSVE